MKWIAEVLDKFTPKERIIVLILLLTFTSFIYMGTNYFNSDKYDNLNRQYEELSFKYIQLLNTDNCAPLREQNIKLIQDLVVISDVIRTYRNILNEQLMVQRPPTQLLVRRDSMMNDGEIRPDAFRLYSPPPPEPIIVDNTAVLLELLNTIDEIVNNSNTN
jgi:hypothetical protein